jgi:hypothetical protein
MAGQSRPPHRRDGARRLIDEQDWRSPASAIAQRRRAPDQPRAIDLDPDAALRRTAIREPGRRTRSGDPGRSGRRRSNLEACRRMRRLACSTLRRYECGSNRAHRRLSTEQGPPPPARQDTRRSLPAWLGRPIPPTQSHSLRRSAPTRSRWFAASQLASSHAHPCLEAGTMCGESGIN